MAEDRLKLAVFIDFDNIRIGVKDTLGRDFDVSVVLEALKERGEVVSKIAYGDWARAEEQSRQMTQHAVQLVQRNLTPRGDKNGADINLALDALEMAFTRDHINAFAIVGGDSDFITLVEKLKQFDKRVFVVGGRQFTSGILQRNCHEFIAYENLLRYGEGSRATRSTRAGARAGTETRPLSAALPNLHRALKMLAEREVSPQIGLLKSTILQLDPTFSERDYGAGSFLEFIQKLQKASLAHLRKTGRGHLVEAVEAEGGKEPASETLAPESASITPAETPPVGGQASAAEAPPPQDVPAAGASSAAALGLLKRAVAGLAEKAPARPLYMRQVRQMMRSLESGFDERQAGFRGMLDLFHQAQREGWLRLHRDHKGVWRIFPVVSAPAVAPAEAEPAKEVAAVTPEPLPAEAPTVSEMVEQAEVVAPQIPLLEIPEPVPEEVSPREEPGARKVRKPRAKATGRAGRRRTSPRRKPDVQPD